MPKALPRLFKKLKQREELFPPPRHAAPVRGTPRIFLSRGTEAGQMQEAT